MASIVRHTAVWSGFTGAPGYSNLYHHWSGDFVTAVQSGHNDVYTFFAGLATLIPADVEIKVDPIYSVIDEVTGEITTEGTVGTPTIAVDCENANGYSAFVGVAVDWITGVFIDGRQVRGRTYIVPAAGMLDDDGTLTGGAVTTIQTAALAITESDQEFVVWHRPVAGAGGDGVPIAAGIARDHAYVLRSRSR